MKLYLIHHRQDFCALFKLLKVVGDKIAHSYRPYPALCVKLFKSLPGYGIYLIRILILHFVGRPVYEIEVNIVQIKVPHRLVKAPKSLVIAAVRIP